MKDRSRALWLVAAVAVATGGISCLDFNLAYQSCVNDGRCPDDGGSGGGVGGGTGGGSGGGIGGGSGGGGGGGSGGGVGGGSGGGTGGGTGGGSGGGSGGGTGGGSGGGTGGGTGGGSGGGGGSTGPYDGGTACPTSPNQRLRCDAPLTLTSNATDVTGAVLAGNTQGFYAGWVTSTNAELRLVDPGTKSITPLLSIPGMGSGQFSVDARGTRWAAAWAADTSDIIHCITSDNDAGVAFSSDAGAVATLTVATSPNGAVGIGGKSASNFWGNNSTTGCPTKMLQQGNFGTNYASVVYTNGATGNGFRFPVTSQINAANGGVDVYQILDGGSFDPNSAFVNPMMGAPQSHASMSSTTGDTVLVTYSLDDGNGNYTLGLAGFPSDMGSPGTPILESTENPGWWSMGACGAGCAAEVHIPYSVAKALTVSFFTDDTAVLLRGKYDALCAQQAQSSSMASVAIAYAGGRLGLLLTGTDNAKLYLCDVPPLP